MRKLLERLRLGLVLGVAVSAAATDDELDGMSREERVRVLGARTWEIHATRIDGGLTIDGRLDEEAWTRAQPVENLYQRETFEGLPATEPTHVWVLYDETNLYLGYRAYDSDPDRQRARAMFRDENVGSDDAIAVMIDAYNDRRSAVFLATNANGIVFDMLQNGEDSRSRNLNWDTVWHARGGHTEIGWEAEVVVPFTALRFDPPEGEEEILFGIGFKRNLPRKNEETYWPFVSNDSTWYRPAELGTLRGLRGIRSGRAVEVRPYALGGADRTADRASTDTSAGVGVDAKWGVTTGLTADFTVETDFAQEEVDVQQLNFTRFSLFFPEKRQIFLESERSFLFGVRREADLVFTRRIGLSSSGEVVPLRGGARLSGRQGAYSVGIMSMQTGEEETLGLATENFTVARVRRDLFSRSTIGALFTNRQGGGSYNRVYGADLNLFLGRDWSFDSYVARMDEPGVTDGNHSAYARLEWNTDRYGAVYRYLDIGENFRPGVGFVRRPNSRQHRAFARFSPRPSAGLVRQLRFTPTFDYVPNQQGVLETRKAIFDAQLIFESGDSIAGWFDNNYEFLEGPFFLRPDVVVPAGEHSFNTGGIRFDSFRRRHARIGVGLITGGFWDGGRDSLFLNLDYRVNKHVGLSGDYAVNWVDLPSGSFTTHLLSTRVEIAVRTDIILMSLFQYNHDTRQLSSNVRFNWIPKPGSDFFVVYNELDEWNQIFDVKNRSLSVKMNYLLAF